MCIDEKGVLSWGVLSWGVPSYRYGSAMSTVGTKTFLFVLTGQANFRYDGILFSH